MLKADNSFGKNNPVTMDAMSEGNHDNKIYRYPKGNDVVVRICNGCYNKDLESDDTVKEKSKVLGMSR